MAPEGAFQLHFPSKHMEGLFGATFVVGGHLSAPSNYIFHVSTLAIGGRRTVAKGVFSVQGGGHDPVPPPPTPLPTYQ